MICSQFAAIYYLIKLSPYQLINVFRAEIMFEGFKDAHNAQGRTEDVIGVQQVSV